jgi:hypothetical protein
MRRGRIAAVIAALITLMAGSAAVAGPANATGCPDGGYTSTPGERIKGPNSPAVYLVDPEGRRRWIPNERLYTELFRSWNGIKVRSDINCIIRGRDLDPIDTALRKSSDSPKVYIVMNGYKRWIVSEAVFNKYHFNWGSVVVRDPWLINSIPDGPNWT